jgi:hypothetical protein
MAHLPKAMTIFFNLLRNPPMPVGPMLNIYPVMAHSQRYPA